MRRAARLISRKIASAVFPIILLISVPSAQQTNLNPQVTFTLDFPKSNPQHYSISVDSTGHAQYECAGKVAADADQDTYRADFQFSRPNRDRIFLLAKQAGYFSGKIDSGNNKLAFTGDKTLTYQDASRSDSARYNYSNSDAVRQLTTLFQNTAATLEYGWRLEYFHRYQKLALDEELKRMESQAADNELAELQSVTPVLHEIMDDTTVINVVRARAKELIQMGQMSQAARSQGR
ncbi:MAG TPA: hypothetical protein VND65_09645 [Candidatus Binatia bacterium]|nr:hypothetical protein [Candidatus Binatia bacterium]